MRQDQQRFFDFENLSKLEHRYLHRCFSVCLYLYNGRRHFPPARRQYPTDPDRNKNLHAYAPRPVCIPNFIWIRCMVLEISRSRTSVHPDTMNTIVSFACKAKLTKNGVFFGKDRVSQGNLAKFANSEHITKL